MIKYFLQTQIFALLTILTCVSFCNGQSRTNPPNNSVGDRKTIPTGKPKLIKTQGSNEYANVYCGIQDKEGNLWFGTSGEGVYRFDGKLFTQFTTKDGLNSNIVNCILQDRQGNLWFGTSDGPCRFNGKNMIPITINGNFLPTFGNTDYYNARSKPNTVWSMFQDKKGTIWFASGCPPGEEGICRYDGKDLVNFKPKGEGWFRKIMEDKNGNLLFATRIHGVLSCDLNAGTVSMASFSGFPQPKALLNNSLTTILKDGSGNIWMAADYGQVVGDTLGGLWCYKPSSEAGEKAFTKITAREVSFLLEDRTGNIWLGTRNTGLYRYDGKAITNFNE